MELFVVRIQSECGKIRTRNNSVFGHFSRSGDVIEKRTETVFHQKSLMTELIKTHFMSPVSFYTL